MRFEYHQWKHTSECKQIDPIRTAIGKFMSTATPEDKRRQILSSIKDYKLFKQISRPCNCYLSAELVLKNLD